MTRSGGKAYSGRMDTRDRLARRLAVVALIAAAGGYLFGSARADSVSEPDAFLVAQRLTITDARLASAQGQITDLQHRVAILEGASADAVKVQAAADADALVAAGRIDALEDRDASGCLVVSRGRFIRQHRHGELRRLPLVAWDSSSPGCRSSSKVWEPDGRVMKAVAR